MADVVVRGEVTDLHRTGTGFRVRESWESKDGPKSRYWSVFPRQGEGSVAVGYRVKVEGRLSAKVAQNPKFVDHAVSDASVIVEEWPETPQEPRGDANAVGSAVGDQFDPWSAQAGDFGNASSGGEFDDQSVPF